MAVVRAKMEQCVVMLGTATPSLESYHNAVQGKYLLLNLTQRVDNSQMPFMRIVDLRSAAEGKGRRHSLRTTAHRNHEPARETRTDNPLSQSPRVLDFAPCSACGEARNARIAALPSPTTGRGAFELPHVRAHRCRARRSVRPAAGRVDLFGVGTEKVESNVAQIFPQAACDAWIPMR